MLENGRFSKPFLVHCFKILNISIHSEIGWHQSVWYSGASGELWKTRRSDNLVSDCHCVKTSLLERHLGITDPDHMIQFTIVSYHRYKNGKDLEIDKQVAYYKSEREKFLLEYRSKLNVISTETRPAKKGN